MVVETQESPALCWWSKPIQGFTDLRSTSLRAEREMEETSEGFTPSPSSTFFEIKYIPHLCNSCSPSCNQLHYTSMKFIILLKWEYVSVRYTICVYFLLLQNPVRTKNKKNMSHKLCLFPLWKSITISYRRIVCIKLRFLNCLFWNICIF